MKPKTRNTLLVVIMSLVMMLASCDILGGKEDPKTPTVPDASFKVAIKGSALTGGKINFGGKLTVAVTDNKLAGEATKIQWTRDGIAISDATKEEYTISKTDEDKGIGVAVTIKGETVKAADIAIPKRTLTVVIGGDAIDDKGTVDKTGTLSAEVTKNWEVLDKDGNEVSTTYQWIRGGTNISGATKEDYVLTADDAGKTITVKATYDSVNGTSAGVKIPTTSASTQSLKVTITGTPGVGNWLFADVQKNFVGEELKYQWLRDGQNIYSREWDDWYEYIPDLLDLGKKISVKVKCGEIISDPSAAVTIPSSFIYTVELGFYTVPGEASYAYAYVLIGDDGYYTPTNQNGFSVQWLRDGSTILGATEYFYSLQPEDAGKTIKARVTGYGKTVTSDGYQVPTSGGSGSGGGGGGGDG